MVRSPHLLAFQTVPGFMLLAKGGLHAMSRRWRERLASRGIRINVVAPGFIQTPMWERVPLPADAMNAITKRLLGKCAARSVGPGGRDRRGGVLSCI